jgi:hypothetical protein
LGWRIHEFFTFLATKPGDDFVTTVYAGSTICLLAISGVIVVKCFGRLMSFVETLLPHATIWLRGYPYDSEAFPVAIREAMQKLNTDDHLKISDEKKK